MNPQDRPSQNPELADIAADDRLLDSLLTPGGQPTDTLAFMLSAARSDLHADDLDTGDLLLLEQQQLRGRRRSAWRATTAAALVCAAVAGGLTGARSAEPGSPLWPVTRMVYPQRADLILAGVAIDDARRAAEQRRYGDARADLEHALDLLAGLGTSTEAERLREEIRQIETTLVPSPAQQPQATEQPRPMPATAGGQPAPVVATPGPAAAGASTEPPSSNGAAGQATTTPTRPPHPDPPSSGARALHPIRAGPAADQDRVGPFISSSRRPPAMDSRGARRSLPDGRRLAHPAPFVDPWHEVTARGGPRRRHP
jgi:hypothetical protein